MDKRPRHGEDGDLVALGGDQQLLKRCLRMTPPKADQDTPRGVEDADTGFRFVFGHIWHCVTLP